MGRYITLLMGHTSAPLRLERSHLYKRPVCAILRLLLDKIRVVCDGGSAQSMLPQIPVKRLLSAALVSINWYTETVHASVQNMLNIPGYMRIFGFAWLE